MFSLPSIKNLKLSLCLKIAESKTPYVKSYENFFLSKNAWYPNQLKTIPYSFRITPKQPNSIRETCNLKITKQTEKP